MKDKNNTFIDDYAEAIATVINSLTPLIIGAGALGCGTYLMNQAILAQSDNKFIAASSASTALFGAGIGGTLGTVQPGLKDRKKRFSAGDDIIFNEHSDK